MEALLFTALLVGLAGGVHCVAMCGGIVGALNLRAGDAQPIRMHPGGAAAARPIAFTGDLTRQLSYSAGRISSYAVAGAIAGGLGGMGTLLGDVLPVQLMLLVAANVLVILLGMHLAGWSSLVLVLERGGGRLWRLFQRLGARLAPANTAGGAFGTGLAWGWIPCGLVYSMLATALVSGGPGRGALVMAAFGLGTLPTLLTAGMVTDRLRGILRHPRARLVAGVSVILAGIFGLVRVPGLAEHIRQGLLCLN
jgi:hypothetical protein